MTSREPPPTVALTTGSGLSILVRRLRSADRDELRRGFERLSDQSVYRRFFTRMPELGEPLLDRLTDIDPEDAVVLGAIDAASAVDPGDGSGVTGTGVGVVRAVRRADDPTRAELAVVVTDDYHRQGVGSTLVAAVAALAEANGIDTLDGLTLAENRAMAALLRTLGGSLLVDEDDRTVLELEMDASVAAERLAPAERRRLVDALADPKPQR